MRIGFTGTSAGMTAKQKAAVRALLRRLRDRGWGLADDDFHHGVCIGADEQAHAMAETLGFRVWLHPPTDEKALSKTCKAAYETLPSRPYLARNRAIVDDSDLLIATPKTLDEKAEPRSGTWYTVRYAKSKGVPTVMVWP